MADRIALNKKVLSNLAAQGEAGAAWLAGLPALVENLEHSWGIKVGRIFPNATEAYVAVAITGQGEELVFKVPVVGIGKIEREVDLLKTANGRGYARLLNHDAASGAMLLERLGLPLAQQSLPIEDQIAIICETLRNAWMPPPPGLRVVTGAEKARTMASYIASVWSKLGKPCSEKTVAIALQFAEARADAFDPATSVVSHGDAHAWNTLHDPTTGGYKFVDPDGWFAEPAHDLSISMREWPNAFLAGDAVALGRKRSALLAQLSGVDSEAIWQWGLIEQLMNGLSYLDVGPKENATQFLKVANAWACG